MSSKSSAPKENKKLWKLSWWHILLVTLLLLAVPFFLFPEKMLVKSILRTGQASPLSLMYLRNLAVINPKDKELHLALAQQEFNSGNYENANKALAPIYTDQPNSAIQWEALSLYYQIIRSETYALADKSTERLQSELKLKNLLPILIKSNNLTDEQVKNIIQDALGLNEPSLAVSMYKKIMAKNPDQPIEFYINAGKIALYAKDYQTSADFYHLAMGKAQSIPEKRTFFQSAVNSLLSSGNPNTALNYAIKNIDGLANDQLTLLFITKTALAANKPKIAEQYVKQVLQFKNL